MTTKDSESTGSKYINVPCTLSVDDQTRQWFAYRPPTYDGNLATVTKRLQVHDGRQHPNKLTIDDSSFELINCPTKLSTSEFYTLQLGGEEGDALRERYYDEVAAVLKERLKCDKVVPFLHLVRNEDKLTETGGKVQGYVDMKPHTDSSPVSADQLALSMAGGEEEKYERYAYVNLWRNIAEEPIGDNHLAMLDERTTAKPDDYITTDLLGDGFSTVMYGLNARHSSSHKWYYFPQMEKDEGIIFKEMDSDYTKSGRICFHMSIKDPDANPAAPPRESIEVHALCYWNKTEGGLDTMPTKENTNASMLKNPEEEIARNTGGLFTKFLKKIVPVIDKFLS